jgi:hypothetical protein
MQGAEFVEGGCVIKAGATAGTKTERWATVRPRGGGLPRPDGREPSGRAAAARSAGPLPQVGGTRRHAASITTPA